MKTLRLLAFLSALLPVVAHAQMSGADMYNPASATTSGSSGVSSVTCDGTLLSCATTGAITLTTTNAPAYSFWGNATGSTAAPGYTNSPEVLNLTTSGTLSVRGNASLSGTTTLATAQIAAGNATLTNLTATTVTGTTGNFPTLNFTNALGTTITDTTENTTTLNFTNALGTTITATNIEGIGNAKLAGTTTVANLSITGTCTGCGSGGGVTSFSGDSALLSNSSSTGAVTATLTNATAKSVWGNASGSSGAPSYLTAPVVSGIMTAASFVPTSSTIATDGLYLPAANTSGIADNSQPVIETVGVASAVDFFTLTNAATANPANLSLTASGSDSNLNIVITPKGTGGVAIGTTTATDNVMLAVNGDAANSNGYAAELVSSASTGTAFILNSTASGGDKWQFTSGTTSGASAHSFVVYDITATETGFEVTSGSVAAVRSSGVFAWLTTNQYPSIVFDTGISRDAAGVIDFGTGTQGSTAALVQSAGYASKATKFTATGCSNSTTVGGATVGKFTSGTTGTCTVTITMNGATGLTAPNAWDCHANDLTTPANLIDMSASNATTATITGSTFSGDIISFSCMAY